jgi:hypothetical protein
MVCALSRPKLPFRPVFAAGKPVSLNKNARAHQKKAEKSPILRFY